MSATLLKPIYEFSHFPPKAFDHMTSGDIGRWLESEFMNPMHDECPSVCDIGGPISWLRAGFRKFSGDAKTKVLDAVLDLFDDALEHQKKWQEMPD